MTKITTQIDNGSSEFNDNQSAMAALVENLRVQATQVALGGNEKSRERHIGRGKLLPRERVNGLLDPGSLIYRFTGKLSYFHVVQVGSLSS